jgi:methylmalonyl-CoA mutase
MGNHTWNEKINKYKDPVYTFKVRDKNNANAYGITFSFSNPKIALPSTKLEIFYAGVYRKMFLENIRSPLVYILSREREDPSRMFAGEGGPERTNKRFHYVSAELPKRLSTALIV